MERTILNRLDFYVQWGCNPSTARRLRMLRQQLGHVQVLAVERRGVEGGGGEPPPSLACQQLALTIEAPPLLWLSGTPR
jgi:hypothetical protein